MRVGFLKHRLVSQHIGSTYNVRVTRLDAKNTKKIKITSKKLTGNKLESKAISAGLYDRSTTFLVDLNLSLKDTGSDLKRSFLTQYGTEEKKGCQEYHLTDGAEKEKG